MALALGTGSDSRADRFLEVQTALAADQRHHLHEQLKQIHLDIWEKWLGVILRAATAVVGMAFASALAWMVWVAAHSDGLKVEPFNVPADLAARGETGQVL